ncbi:hypothetical protein DPM13_18430 [Paracoccus mutanolyticus]|uniref:Transposase DDE domain-containing protein n=1 Tax=Paracoccus mutanolyticus TaxID=1499308 RepID=A0ABM6WU76_9RHOB|nr:hypothetical protein DPM13_18430 [Paracoccus mutanolyticus]
MRGFFVAANVADHRTRLFMKLRQDHSTGLAAAKAGLRRAGPPGCKGLPCRRSRRIPMSGFTGPIMRDVQKFRYRRSRRLRLRNAACAYELLRS